jgi:prolyl oligopeptidase
MSVTVDPHAWLEEVLGEKPLQWVKERNEQCITAVGDPLQMDSYKRILGIFDSKDKIPGVTRIGNWGYFNYWQDEAHVRGIWRRTTLESYRTTSPDWHTVIDVDALPPPQCDTAKSWVWHGYALLDEGPQGAYDRAIIRLSPGGSDADTSREFDLKEEKWVSPEEGGFALPTAAKTDLSFRSRNEVLVGTDFAGDGSTLTDSGYPRVVRSWRRGTPLSEAVTVFECQKTDIYASQEAYYDRGFLHEIQKRTIDFYTCKRWYRSLKDLSVTAPLDPTPFVPIPIPDDSSFTTFADMAIIELRTDWTIRAQHFTAGSLLAAPINEVMRDEWQNTTVLFAPSEASALVSFKGTKDFLALKLLTHVRTELRFWQYSAGVWSLVECCDVRGSGVGVGEDVEVRAVYPDENNLMWVSRYGYLVPDNLSLASSDTCLATPELLKSKPAMFNAAGLVVEQYFATSLDGTRIPYFVCRRENIEFDGSHVTLLDAYGGFEISMLPGYAAGVGAAWLERGGIKVIANIRGGGEYGPKWHQAALKGLRHKAYEDVEAVAADLIARRITRPDKLAVIGGSNGGLLVGNMLTRPLASTLFGAAVCQVPLLDMKRYSHLLAGASWMAEYGDPDTSDWNFVRKISPYHMLRHDCLGIPEQNGYCSDLYCWESSVGAMGLCPKHGGLGAPGKPDWVCPKVLFTTSTRDDRVHPGHARKMVRALIEECKAQCPVVEYWENIEGGHGGAADNKQRAFMWALSYEFLAQCLGLGTKAVQTQLQ